MKIYQRPKRFEWFRNQLIRNKIMLVYVPLIIIPLVILSIASNHIYRNAIVEKTIKSVSDNSSLIITQINGIVSNTESAANMLTLNLNKLIIVDPEKASYDQMSDFQLATQITNQLSYALVVFPDVESAAFIDQENRIYGSNLKMEANDQEFVNSGFIKELQQSKGSNIWFPMQKRTFLVTNPDEPVLTMGKRIVNINTGVTIGYVVLNIRESVLSSMYEHIGPLKEGTYFIADNQGMVVSSQNREEVLKPINDDTLRDWVMTSTERAETQYSPEGKMLVISSNIPNFDWNLISIMSYDLLTDDTSKITRLIALIGLICFIFTLFGARALSNLIAKPIIQLAHQMKKVKEGNLEQQIEVNSGDEIGILASGFNRMIRQVQELLVNIATEQRKKREYELALIQAQIKPHFLYNTLDVIYTLSEMGRTRDVQRTTKSLADFYRVVLSKGKDQIKLEEEVRSVMDYLAIQRIRYSDVFDYEIDIEPNIVDCMVPKLTIQPLVENAIYHGLKNKMSFGKLKITGRREQQKVLIIVSDDGAGIAEDRLQAIKQSMIDPQHQVGYGLISVNERIKLYFGLLYGIDIHSEIGIGTVVTLELPYQSA